MIRLQNVHIRVPGFSVNDVTMSIEPGEFFALIGPTGAGKTLILEAIGGIVPVERGWIRLDGRDVTHMPPEKRNVGIVYQDCALFPHLSVYDNIVYGLRYHRRSAATVRTVLDRLFHLLDLESLLHRYPVNLSGGERQRVALARALCVQPAVLLLDEPLSALDPVFRDDIRRMLKSLHHEVGITFFMVTHDFSQLIFLADRAAIIQQGSILQQGAVDDLFRRPANDFVARFVGMKNVFPAEFDGLRATVDGLEIKFDSSCSTAGRFIAIRPENIILSDLGAPTAQENFIEGAVSRVIDEGLYCEVTVATEGPAFTVVTTKSVLTSLRLVSGDRVRLYIPASCVHVF